MRIMFSLMIFIAIALAMDVNAAHFMCGKVNDASDGTSAQWRLVYAYINTPKDNVSCEVTPIERKYCCDIESLSQKWKIGNITTLFIPDDDSGYFAGPVQKIATGEGFDQVNTMTLMPTLIVSGINSYYESRDVSAMITVNNPAFTNRLYYTLNQGNEVTICNNCASAQLNLANLSNNNYILKIFAQSSNLQKRSVTELFQINKNDPPSFTSTPITTANEDSLYTYSAHAYDPNGDLVYYTLISAPANMSINSTSGLITWTPDDIDVGQNQVSIQATDGKGGIDLQAYTLNVINVNDPPVITSSPLNISYEGSLYNYDVDANDQDKDMLSYSLITSPPGMMIDTASGLISWTPHQSDVGQKLIKVQVTDGNGGIAIQDYTLEVIDVNFAPVFSSVPITTANEDSLYTYTVKATDEDSDTLYYSLLTEPLGMTIDPESGVISWIPGQADVGENLIVVRASDNNGAIATQSYTLDVINVNEAPVITSSPVTSAYEDSLYTYYLKASDEDSDTLSYSLVSAPSGMNIDPSSGIITWIPDQTNVGSHLISISVSDGNGGITTQNYSLDVINVNEAPVIVSSPITTTYEDSPYTYDVQATDEDSDLISYSLVSAPLGMTIDASSGIISWTPRQADVGENQVTVEADDGNSGITLQAYKLDVINVNDPPVITSSPITSAYEDSLYAYDVKATDEDSDRISYVLLRAPAGMSIDPSNGSIRLTPQQADVGNNQVSVKAMDGNGGFDIQNYTLNVINVNEAPVIVSSPITETYEDSIYTYHVNATDEDSDTLSYSLLTRPAGMTIDSAIGTITWTPDDINVGNNQISVQVSDGNGGAAVQSFTLNVVNVNDPPVITSSPITSAYEDSLYTYHVVAVDQDRDTLSYRLLQSPATMTIDAATGTITWTPDDINVGNNQISVQVSDGNGEAAVQSFTLNVVNVNDPPVITSSPITSAYEDSLYAYDVKATDEDSDTLSYILVTSPIGMTIDSSTGIIRWAPRRADVGIKQIKIQVSDGHGGTAAQDYSLNVISVNHPPVFSSTPITSTYEDALYTYAANAADDDGDILSYSLLTSPAGMTIDSSTGIIRWTPQQADVGQNNVVVKASDNNGGIATQTYTLNVIHVNHAPAISSSPITTAYEDSSYNYYVQASDKDSDPLSYSLLIAPTRMTINANTGLINWLPAKGNIGYNKVKVQVSDGNSGIATQNFTVNVIHVNHAPVIVSTPVTSVYQDSLYYYNVNASDYDGDPLAYSLLVSPANMSINSTTGAVRWTPRNKDVGQKQVKIQVNDRHGGYNNQSFVLNVININDAPIITSTPSATATQGTPYIYDMKATDIDPTNDTIAYSVNDTIRFAKSGNRFKWTPTQADVFKKIISFRFTATDNHGASAQQTVKVSVINVNDPPKINSTPVLTAVIDSPYKYDADAFDPDNDKLTFQLVTYPSGMQINTNTGLITWIPANKNKGNNNIQLKVSDGNGGTDTQSFILAVDKSSKGNQASSSVSILTSIEKTANNEPRPAGTIQEISAAYSHMTYSSSFASLVPGRRYSFAEQNEFMDSIQFYVYKEMSNAVIQINILEGEGSRPINGFKAYATYLIATDITPNVSAKVDYMVKIQKNWLAQEDSDKSRVIALNNYDNALNTSEISEDDNYYYYDIQSNNLETIRIGITENPMPFSREPYVEVPIVAVARDNERPSQGLPNYMVEMRDNAMHEFIIQIIIFSSVVLASILIIGIIIFRARSKNKKKVGRSKIPKKR